MINWLKQKFRSQGVTVTNGSLSDLFSHYQNNTSGINISAEAILGNPTVYRAINLIAGAVGKIPLHIYRYTDDGREKATALTQYRLLLKQPHDLYTAYVFKHSLLSNALIYGNSYAYVQRNQFGTPTELFLLDPRSTQVQYQNGQLIYRTSINNTQFVLPFSDVIHLKGLSLNGLVGVPLLDVLSNAYGYGLSVQRYSTQYFKNNAKPSIIIELAPHIKDVEKVKEFRRLWAEQHNQTNSYAPAFLTSGHKVIPFSNTNDQSQLIESLEHDILVVANCIGVPASKLGSKQNTSYSSLESESTAFLSDIDCWLVQIEQESESKLLTESAKVGDTHYIQFEREALIKIDSKTQSDVNIAEYNNGIISFEEMRAKLNKNIDKDDKQEWRRPSNIIVESLEAEQLKIDQENIVNAAKAAEVAAEVAAKVEPVTEVPPENEVPKEADSTRSKLDQMTILTLDRLINRLAKSNDVNSHRSIFVQSLSPYERAAEFTDALFRQIEESEDPKAVIENLDSLKLLEELCKHE